MQITFQFEAQLRQIAGTGERQVEVPDGSSLLEALKLLVEQDGGALQERILRADGAVQNSLLLFVNDVPVAPDSAANHVLNNGDQVLLLPPISGG